MLCELRELELPLNGENCVALVSCLDFVTIRSCISNVAATALLGC